MAQSVVIGPLPKMDVLCMREQHNQPFEVSGGCFRPDTKMLMGYQIVDARGITAGVSRDPLLEETLRCLYTVVELLNSADIRYVLSEAHDDGRISISDKDWSLLRDTLKRLGVV